MVYKAKNLYVHSFSRWIQTKVCGMGRSMREVGMPKVLKEKILEMSQLSPVIYKMTLQSEYIAQNASAGQFVNVKCSEGIQALLRRPISICSVDKNNNMVEIVFQIKGVGTELLAKKQPGDGVDLIAPLGKGFHVSGVHKKIIVVGGGIGIFPLLYILKEEKAAEKTAFLGFRNKDYAVMLEEFSKACEHLCITTEDGSLGEKGLIIDPLEAYLKNNPVDIIYTCGPTPMLKRVVEIAAKYNTPCQVSLEQRMGCGIGACLVCACKTRLGDEWEYSHVCKDGPVFWSEEVLWD